MVSNACNNLLFWNSYVICILNITYVAHIFGRNCEKSMQEKEISYNDISWQVILNTGPRPFQKLLTSFIILFHKHILPSIIIQLRGDMLQQAITLPYKSFKTVRSIAKMYIKYENFSASNRNCHQLQKILPENRQHDRFGKILNSYAAARILCLHNCFLSMLNYLFYFPT